MIIANIWNKTFSNHLNYSDSQWCSTSWNVVGDHLILDSCDWWFVLAAVIDLLIRKFDNWLGLFWRSGWKLSYQEKWLLFVLESIAVKNGRWNKHQWSLALNIHALKLRETEPRIAKSKGPKSIQATMKRTVAGYAGGRIVATQPNITSRIVKPSTGRY